MEVKKDGRKRKRKTRNKIAKAKRKTKREKEGGEGYGGVRERGGKKENRWDTHNVTLSE